MSEKGRLTTHVLDTAHGHPARGLALDLFRVHEGGLVPLATGMTDDDGRCAPLLAGAEFAAGAYQLHFHVGDYFRERDGTEAAFLDIVPVRFVVADPGMHYHVPLLVSPFGYSTYRGS